MRGVCRESGPLRTTGKSAPVQPTLITLGALEGVVLTMYEVVHVGSTRAQPTLISPGACRGVVLVMDEVVEIGSSAVRPGAANGPREFLGEKGLLTGQRVFLTAVATLARGWACTPDPHQASADRAPYGCGDASTDLVRNSALSVGGPAPSTLRRAPNGDHTQHIRSRKRPSVLWRQARWHWACARPLRLTCTPGTQGFRRRP